MYRTYSISTKKYVIVKKNICTCIYGAQACIFVCLAKMWPNNILCAMPRRRNIASCPLGEKMIQRGWKRMHIFSPTDLKYCKKM